MSGRSCYFFADENDLADLLEAFEELSEYKFVQRRSDLNEPNKVYSDPRKLLDEAKVTPDNPIRTHSFLVVETSQEVFDREVVLQDGTGVRKIADQNNNFDSIVLAFGGDAGDETLIMSDINTVGDTDKAVEMHKKFKKLVTSMTKNVGVKGSPARLMPGAVEKAKAGWRFASGKDWSRDTDAQISPEALAKL